MCRRSSLSCATDQSAERAVVSDMSTPGTRRTSPGTIEQAKELARARGGLCLSEQYINARSKLLWQCHLGHRWEQTSDNVKRGTWCPVCAKTRKAKGTNSLTMTRPRPSVTGIALGRRIEGRSAHCGVFGIGAGASRRGRHDQSLARDLRRDEEHAAHAGGLVLAGHCDFSPSRTANGNRAPSARPKPPSANACGLIATRCASRKVGRHPVGPGRLWPRHPGARPSFVLAHIDPTGNVGSRRATLLGCPTAIRPSREWRSGRSRTSQIGHELSVTPRSQDSGKQPFHLAKLVRFRAVGYLALCEVGDGVSRDCWCPAHLRSGP